MNKKFLFLLVAGLNFYTYAAVPEINSTGELNSHMKNSDVVVIKFHSPNCPHCQSYAPAFERFATNNTHVKCVSVNVDKPNQLVSNYGIQRLPTTVILKNGKEVGRVTGNNVGQLEAKVKQVTTPSR